MVLLFVLFLLLFLLSKRIIRENVRIDKEIRLVNERISKWDAI